MAVLIIMNIESTMTRHDVIPILESRIRVGRCSATSRNMSTMARTQTSEFLGKIMLWKYVICLEHNIERKVRKHYI